MMQPSEYGHSDDLARIVTGPPWFRNRNALGQPLMWSRRVVISECVLPKRAPHVPLTEDDHVVEGFTAYTAKKPLAHRVHQWRLHRRADHLRTDTLRDPIKVRAVLVVPVPDDELRSPAERRCVSKLLSRPLLARTTSDADMDHLLGVDVGSCWRSSAFSATSSLGALVRSTANPATSGRGRVTSRKADLTRSTAVVAAARRRRRKLDSTGRDLAERRRSYKLVESETLSDPTLGQTASQHSASPYAYAMRSSGLLGWEKRRRRRPSSASPSSMLSAPPSRVGRAAGVTQPHPGLLPGPLASTAVGTDTSPPVAVPVHCPPTQTCPSRQAFPQMPQLRMWVFRSTQACPHCVSPLVQAAVQAPAEQTSSAGQTAPH
jgi:hypothetical protein